MKKKLLAATMGMMVGATANAAGPVVPHSFQAGQKAVASEVNENFQDLADRIDGVSQAVNQKANTTDVNNSLQGLSNSISNLSGQIGQKADTTDVNNALQILSDRIDGLPGGTVLNASDFAQVGITGKSFQISHNSLGCTADNRSYMTSVVGNTTTIVETLIATSAGGTVPCAHVTTTLERNPTGLRVVQVDNRTPDGLSLVNTVTFAPALFYLPAQLSKGSTWSGESLISNSIGPSTALFLAQYTLIGLEDVTVPAGTFANCLKTFRIIGDGFIRAEWRCPGVGLVKRIDTGSPANASGIAELVSVTP